MYNSFRKMVFYMYKLIRFISFVIRAFYLPNPYVNFISSSWADFFNILVGGTILHVLSFALTGVWYRSRSDPGLGSVGYLINYILLVIVVTLLGFFISNLIIFTILLVVSFCFLLVLNSKISQNETIV